MITSLYAGVLALVIVALAIRVIRQRRDKRISLGDGGEAVLLSAIRAHGNATEYIPIALILLLILENSGGHPAIIHGGGLLMLIGRLAHARGIITKDLRFRVIGMTATFTTIVTLALINIGFFLYRSF